MSLGSVVLAMLIVNHLHTFTSHLYASNPCLYIEMTALSSIYIHNTLIRVADLLEKGERRFIAPRPAEHAAPTGSGPSSLQKIHNQDPDDTHGTHCEATSDIDRLIADLLVAVNQGNKF